MRRPGENERQDPSERGRRGPITEQLPAEERARIERGRIRFVLALGRALHRYGTPAHRLEEALGIVCGRLGLRAQIMSTPTSLTFGFGDPSELRTAMMRVDTGELDLAKLERLDALTAAVIDREIDSEDALRRIEAIEAAPPVWGRSAQFITYGLTAASIAVFFGGGWRDVVAGGAVGLVLGLVTLLLRRGAQSRRAVELVGAVVVAFLAHAAARLDPAVSPAVVTVAALIAFLPGLTLTVAMTELATRNLVSGTGRLMSAVIVLLQLALGVALGERAAAALWHVAAVPPVALPRYCEWIALAAGSLGLVIVCQAERRAIGWIMLTSLIAYEASNGGTWLLGPELGVLIGALALGIAANIYARWLDRPQQVVLVPAVILLVPGSLGFRGMSSLLDRNTLSGIETMVATFVVAMAIVAGLLIANAILSPRRVL
ncbi:MAG: threonine/serine exporter family protein [Kofleriaceae bacterium]